MKKFAGFTPQQQYTLLSKQGYTGPADEASMAKFLAASPGAASKMGEYAQIAQQRLAGKPMPTQAMAVGGDVSSNIGPEAGAKIPLSKITGSDFSLDRPYFDPKSVGAPVDSNNPAEVGQPVGIPLFPPVDTPRPRQQIGVDRTAVIDAENKAVAAARAQAADPENEELIKAAADAAKAFDSAKQDYDVAQGQQRISTPTGFEVAGASLKDPMSLVQQASVSKIGETAGTIIDDSVGQAGAVAPTVGTSVTEIEQATAPDKQDAVTIEATKIGENVPQATAAQGVVGDKSLVEAETLSPEQLAQLEVDKPQITDPTQVIPPPARQVQADELISGSAVDMAKVNEAMDFQAAQADPSKMATVQGQLEGLMSQFEGGNTPAWAAGAMRQATATLAARGLGASSMAGQAVVQAAMESAMPVAMADAQTRASFESQNLSNRQQTALFAAEQRAKFLGMEFDQNFQSRVMNAAKVSDIANMNFTADVQIALENSRLTQTASLANLDVSKAKMLSDMAAMTQVDLTNLNNRQQAAVQNAQSFLQTDLTNLNNEQQTTIFNTQNKMNSLLSDQAAENAAKQFNAASENQTNQFFAELSTTVSRFNAEQQNAIAQFNAAEANALAKFDTQVQAQRDEFNANNSLIIAQANAVWRQNIDTLNTAAENEATREAAKAANGFTQSTVDQIWQRERDIMNAALTTAEGDANRNVSLMLGDIEARALAKSQKAADTSAMLQFGANLAFPRY